MSKGDVPTRADTTARALAELATNLPMVGGALKIVLEETWTRRRAAAEATVQEISDVVGGPDRLASRLAEDPVLEALFCDAVDGAVRTGMESKRRLFARVIGAAVLDDAKVDDALLVVRALRELDAPDIRFLEAIRRAYDSVTPASSTEDPARDVESERRQAVQDATRDMPAPVRAALVATGTIKNWAGLFGGTTDLGGPSDFGRALLADLVKGHDGSEGR